REFVGLGPYRLERWDLGVALEAVPFDRHALGLPKIQRIRFVVIGDSNAVAASLRAGTVHVAADSINFAQSLELKRDWVPATGGTVTQTFTSLRMISFQLRPELADPRA